MGPVGRALVEQHLRWSDAALDVEVHPSLAHDPAQAVRRTLDGWLLRVREEFDGVVLAHKDVSVHGASGAVLSYAPYVRVRARARLLLFRPAAGRRVVGRVNHVGADHVGLVVLGAFNAALARADVRGTLSADVANARWAGGGGGAEAGHVLGLGDDVVFTVKQAQEVDGGGLLHITGELTAPDTGNVEWLLSRGVRLDDDDDGPDGAAAGTSKAPKEKRRGKEEGEGAGDGKRKRGEGKEGKSKKERKERKEKKEKKKRRKDDEDTG